MNAASAANADRAEQSVVFRAASRRGRRHHAEQRADGNRAISAGTAAL
jgi:hypothetical protein